ncbi:MAG: glycosidase, partial [Flavitalea sp.]
MRAQFEQRLQLLQKEYQELIDTKNKRVLHGNGVYDRYENPVLTAQHAPISWRYDLDFNTNPYLMERFGINAAFNAGAIKFNNKYVLIARVEGMDRKSFFAVAESDNGIDNFRFRDRPVTLPETNEPDTNV